MVKFLCHEHQKSKNVTERVAVTPASFPDPTTYREGLGNWSHCMPRLYTNAMDKGLCMHTKVLRYVTKLPYEPIMCTTN